MSIISYINKPINFNYFSDKETYITDIIARCNNGIIRLSRVRLYILAILLRINSEIMVYYKYLIWDSS